MARAMCMTVALTLTAVVVQAQLPVGGSLVGENPSAMLTELEGMVRSGETPAFELITTIENLIQAEIMPGLGNTQDSASQDTAAALSAIDTCNSQSKTKEGQIEGTEEVAVNNARSIHAACRESEKSLYDHNLTDPSSDCVKLGKFLHGATLLEIPAGIDRSWSVQYVKDNADKNMCGQSAVTELDNGCSAQESALAEEKAKCASNQGTFERAFCTWKTALESNCKQLETCHSQKVAAYDSHVTVRKALVEKWNVETGALQKILCYCKVWLSAKDERDQGDDRSKHNATQFEVCTGQSYVPTDVNYGTPADKVPCLLTSVAEHPGTSGFITQEYSSFTDFFQPVDPCAEATTVAPTTGVPTTEAPPTNTPCEDIPANDRDAPVGQYPRSVQCTTMVAGGWCTKYGPGGGGRRHEQIARWCQKSCGLCQEACLEPSATEVAWRKEGAGCEQWKQRGVCTDAQLSDSQRAPFMLNCPAACAKARGQCFEACLEPSATEVAWQMHGIGCEQWKQMGVCTDACEQTPWGCEQWNSPRAPFMLNCPVACAKARGQCSEAASLVYGLANSNVCPGGSTAITDAASCEARTVANGFQFLRSASQHYVDPTRPSGCIRNAYAMQSYFNPHLAGAAHSAFAVVCNKAR